MYPSRLDDKGRLKLPVAFKQFFDCLRDKKLFVTSLDGRTAQVYPMAVWRTNEKFFENYREDPELARNVLFNASDLGSEAEMDGQGRILFSPELRRELNIENQSVKLYAYRGHIEIITEQTYEERRKAARQTEQSGLTKLEAAGLN